MVHSPANINDAGTEQSEGDHWYNLGLELYVEDDELNTIRRNNPQDQDNCKREMFRKWLSNCPQASYRQLVRALVSVGDVREAERVSKDHGKECMHAMLGQSIAN